MNNLLVAFDVGFSRISAAVARIDSFKQMHIVAVTSVENYGIKKSVVVDMDQMVEAISKCRIKLEGLVDAVIDEAYISIHGGFCKILDSAEKVELNPRGTISEKDIEAVTDASKKNTLPENSEIVWLHPAQYKVDNYYNIKDPIGMRGNELTLEAKIFAADSYKISEMIKCMESAGVKVKGIIPQPLALEKLIVSEENSKNSAGIINIGAETIDLSIYENGSICYTNCIPLGGNSITKDIMTCLSISFAEAENIKFQYTGKSTNASEIDDESQEDSTAARYNGGMINEIIEARAEELLSFALEEINSIKKLKEFDSIFITGSGIMHYKDIIARFEEELEKPIISIENNMMGAASSIYSVPVGMLKVVIDTIRISKINESDSVKQKSGKRSKGIVGKLKQFMENFI